MESSLQKFLDLTFTIFKLEVYSIRYLEKHSYFVGNMNNFESEKYAPLVICQYIHGMEIPMCSFRLIIERGYLGVVVNFVSSTSLISLGL